MTRKEAATILLSLGWFETDKFLNAIESLGLIKFDLPKEKDEFLGQIIKDCRNSTIIDFTGEPFIRALDARGYKIVKK